MCRFAHSRKLKRLRIETQTHIITLSARVHNTRARTHMGRGRRDNDLRRFERITGLGRITFELISSLWCLCFVACVFLWHLSALIFPLCWVLHISSAVKQHSTGWPRFSNMKIFSAEWSISHFFWQSRNCCHIIGLSISFVLSLTSSVNSAAVVIVTRWSQLIGLKWGFQSVIRTERSWENGTHNVNSFSRRWRTKGRRRRRASRRW